MKTKLSEIEQLRLERAKLMQECRLYEEELNYKLNYTKKNFGHLLSNTFLTSAKRGFSDLLSPFFGKKKKEEDEESSKKSSSGISQILIAASPFLWELLQPLLVGIAVKKAKSIFIRKKKKK